MARAPLIVVALTLAAAACAGAPSVEQDPSRYEGPIGSTDVALGEARFRAVCGVCHVDGDAPVLDGRGLAAAAVRRQAREGSARMRPVAQSRVSDAELEAIVAYLVTTGAARD